MAERHSEFKASLRYMACGLQKETEGTLDRVDTGKEKEAISKDYNILYVWRVFKNQKVW